MNHDTNTLHHEQPVSDPRWQFWVDRGGTFTDIVARRPDGKLVTHKLLSECPERYPDAVVQGMRELLGVAPGAPLPVERIESIGNAAGDGARMALFNRRERRRAHRLAESMRVVELSNRADFQDMFVACTELSDAVIDLSGE